MSEPERFAPTLKQALSENAIVGLGVLVFAPIIIWLRRGHWWMAVASGAAGAFLVFLFYTLRFLRRAPRSLRFSETALTLELLRGGESQIRWSDIRRAKRSSYGGLKWRLWTDASFIDVRDDGFSAAQWEEISNHISRELTAREVPMTIVSR